MERDLQIVFNTVDGSTKYVTVQDAKESLTLADVTPVAELIIANDIFSIDGSNAAASLKEARVVVKEVTVLV